MKLYHGTTADALPFILKNGLTIDAGGGNWEVSGRAIYFWSPAALMERNAECDSSDDEEFFACLAAKNAISSGEFGLGFSKDCRVVLLTIELDERVFEVEPDESCEGMAGAVCVWNDVPPSAIKSIEISDDLSLLRGYYLSMHLGRGMSSRRHDFTPMQEKIANLFMHGGVSPDDADDMRNMQAYNLPL